jgi:hypothetical protein
MRDLLGSGIKDLAGLPLPVRIFRYSRAFSQNTGKVNILTRFGNIDGLNAVSIF